MTVFRATRSAILGLVILVTRPPAVAALICPTQLPSSHFGFEQVGPTPSNSKRLKGFRLFDGPPGEESKTAPVELAPDHTSEQPGGWTQTWRFAGNEDLLMVCVYTGSATYYRAQPRPIPGVCAVESKSARIVARCE